MVTMLKHGANLISDILGYRDLNEYSTSVHAGVE
jgi:hypothetical protein